MCRSLPNAARSRQYQCLLLCSLASWCDGRFVRGSLEWKGVIKIGGEDRVEVKCSFVSVGDVSSWCSGTMQRQKVRVQSPQPMDQSQRCKGHRGPQLPFMVLCSPRLLFAPYHLFIWTTFTFINPFSGSKHLQQELSPPESIEYDGAMHVGGY